MLRSVRSGPAQRDDRAARLDEGRTLQKQVGRLAAPAEAGAVQAAFVHGAHRAFLVAAAFVFGTLVIVATAVKGEPRLSKA